MECKSGLVEYVAANAERVFGYCAAQDLRFRWKTRVRADSKETYKIQMRRSFVEKAKERKRGEPTKSRIIQAGPGKFERAKGYCKEIEESGVRKSVHQKLQLTKIVTLLSFVVRKKVLFVIRPHKSSQLSRVHRGCLTKCVNIRPFLR